MFDRRHLFGLSGVVLLLGLAACSSDSGPSEPTTDEEAELTTQIRETLTLDVLPATVAYPPDNHPGDEGYATRVELGRLLFYDPVLSGNDDISCGHCHHPAFAWADARGLSIGVGGHGLGPDRERGLPRDQADLSEWEFITPRNSPTILDTGRNAPFAEGDGPWDGRMFWDGRTASLEAQARAPVRSRDEMRSDAYPMNDAVSKVIEELQAIPAYVEMFVEAFPDVVEQLALPEGYEQYVINGNTYARAIAAYERELFTADAPFDDFARGVDGALTLQQKKGLLLFHEKGCRDCHGGAEYSDFEFRAMGVRQGGPGKPPIHERGDGSDVGRYSATDATQFEPNRFAFRTPMLRNVALTAPYFHTGGEGTADDYRTLRQVVEFYNRGGNDQGLSDDHLDDFFDTPLNLDDDEIDAIVAFLESLTSSRIVSDLVDPTVPTSVPSGLTPPADLPPVISN